VQAPQAEVLTAACGDSDAFADFIESASSRQERSGRLLDLKKGEVHREADLRDPGRSDAARAGIDREQVVDRVADDNMIDVTNR